MKRSSKITLGILACFALIYSGFLFSCNHDNPDENDGDTIEPPTTAPIKKDIVVYFYMDNTNSMKGYFNSTQVSSLAQYICAVDNYWRAKDNVTVESFYTQSKKVKGGKQTDIVPVDFETVKSNISSKKLLYTDSYVLDKFFSHVVNKLLSPEHEGIAFFVTDGIMSATNEEIKNNPNFCKDNGATLGDRCRKEVQRLTCKKTGQKISAAIYQFHSGFNGTYFKYNNNKVQLTEIKRPIYFIVLGEDGLVTDFDKSVKKGLSDFKPINSVLFNRPKSFYLSTSKEVGLREGNIINIGLPDDEGDNPKVQFTFRKDMLPDYLIDPVSNGNAMKITFNHHEVNYNCSDNNISFDITPEFDLPDQPLEIRINEALPGWISLSSSADDSNISQKTPDAKTFLFSTLVKAIKTGIYNSNGSEVYREIEYKINTSK